MNEPSEGPRPPEPSGMPPVPDADPVRDRAGPDLAAALRTARIEDAERASAIADLHTVATARLALLREALAPVLLQIPENVDLFDVGLVPGDPPRLFIDMIAFVEMDRDRRQYRLVQDRRYGRVLIAECGTVDAALEAVTAYIARRLVERDKALASDAAPPGSAASMIRPGSLRGEPKGKPPSYRGGHRSWYVAGQVFWFVVEVLGLLALFAVLALGVHAAWDGLFGS